MTVKVAIGEVTCVPPGSTTAIPIAYGDTIPEGSLIQTGPHSHVMIVWKNASTTVFANSNIRIQAVEHRISVLRGGSNLTLKRDNADTYEIRTPDSTAVLHERGFYQIAVGPEIQLIKGY